MAQAQSWDGLRALWRGIKRVAAIFLMGTVGAVVAGFTAGIVTILAYGFGMIFGILIGFIVGGIVGARTPARDAATVFVASIAVGWPVHLLAGSSSWDQLLGYIASVAAYSLTALVLTFNLKKWFDEATRYWLGVVLSITFAVVVFTLWVVSIYR